MNRRINKKVTKRVLNKVKNDKTLTKFEKRFLKKYLLPTFKETYIAVRQAVELVTNKINELTVDAAREEQLNIDAIDALRYSLENQEVNHTHFHTDEVVSVLSVGHGKMTIEVPETKWQKIKGKVKGLFNK